MPFALLLLIQVLYFLLALKPNVLIHDWLDPLSLGRTLCRGRLTGDQESLKLWNRALLG